MCKDQLCVKHATHHQCTKKHKARVFNIRYCINCQKKFFFWGGGKLEGLGGGEASPPVDETLTGRKQTL